MSDKYCDELTKLFNVIIGKSFFYKKKVLVITSINIGYHSVKNFHGSAMNTGLVFIINTDQGISFVEDNIHELEYFANYLLYNSYSQLAINRSNQNTDIIKIVVINNDKRYITFYEIGK